jgi:hypothetical protein
LSHEDAVLLQKQLMERGYLIGAADGVWGPRAHAAFEDFRRVEGFVPDDVRTEEMQMSLVAQSPEAAEEAQRPLVVKPPETGAPATLEASGAVGEDATPPPRPRALPAEIRDAAPEPRPAALEQPPSAASYVGAWARSRADCFQTNAPPLAISAGRADSFGGIMGSCEFEEIQRDGAGWRTRARCSADGKNWTANVQLRVSGSTLVWSSERGRATYYRCPGG